MVEVGVGGDVDLIQSTTATKHHHHAGTVGITCPIDDHPLDARREPSALEGWTLEVLYCDPKGGRAVLRIFSTEGRGVRLCWAPTKPKGPNGYVPMAAYGGGIPPWRQPKGKS